MKLVFQKQDLSKTLQTVQKTAQAKTNSNVVNGILIKAITDIIEIQANDFDMGYRIKTTGTIEEKGEMVITTSYLSELVRKMPGNTITFISKENSGNVTIIAEKSKFDFLTIPVDNFPLVDIMVSDSRKVYINSADLKELIEDTTYSCASEDSRPIFTGALLDIQDKKVIMVATNTHRMAYKEKLLAEKGTESMKAIIPSKILNEIARLLSTEEPEQVKIVWNRTQIAFEIGNTYVITRLIEGEYPNYEKVIPKNFDAVVTLKRNEINDAVERASIIAKDVNYNVIHYEFSPTEVKLTSQNPDVGMVEEVAACQLEGKNIKISFNSKYVLDILKHLDKEEIYFYMKENGPMMIKQKDDDFYIYVVTPMRA